MVDGGMHDGDVSGEAMDPYAALLERLEGAGWLTGGGFGIDEVHAGFYRQADKFDIGFVEATQKLDIIDESGQVRPGMNVSNDKEMGVLVISYDGVPGTDFDRLVEDLVSWGEELEARQAEALERPEMVDWAQEQAGRLVKQVAVLEAEHEDGLGELDEEYQREIKADVAALATNSMVVGMTEDAAIEPVVIERRLEALFAYVIQQQDDLLEQTEGQPKAAIKPEFDVLDVVAVGVQRELVRYRDARAYGA